jgi:hypothetical protein
MGRDYNSVQLTSAAFTCGICLDFPEKPVECQSCDRLFCEECLARWRETGSRHCPSHCCVPKYCRISHSMEKIFNSASASCTYCSAVFNIREVRTHEAECIHRRTSMEIEGPRSAPVPQRFVFDELRIGSTAQPSYHPQLVYCPQWAGLNVGAFFVPFPTPRGRVETFRLN